MPATITHAYFAKDIYDVLPNYIQKNIDISRFFMFAQGTDPLMFYPWSKKVRHLQHIQHISKSKDFFINMLNYMKNNNIRDKESISLLAGFISHYVLDSICHPFIVYKTGYIKKGNRNTYKYNSIHHFMEVFIDNYIVSRREDINPYKFPIGKVCFNLNKFNKNTVNILDYTFNKTFNYSNLGRIYYKSCFSMKYTLNILRRDSYAIKKFFYKLIDTFTPKSFFRFECLSYHYPLIDKNNFLNSDHKLWRNPAIYSISSNESFDDLYVKAIKIAKVKILASIEYIEGGAVDLNTIFENYSYISGIDVDLKKKIQFFEY